MAASIARSTPPIYGLSSQPAKPALRVFDLSGATVDPLQSEPGLQAAVLLFTTTECPISNRYAPEVQRLYGQYAPRGVRFWLVYPNPADAAAAIRTHREEYGYPMEALRDPYQDLARALQVTVAPEAVVVDASGRVRYRGRIDDRYADIGVDRVTPTRRDLAEALEAVLAGREVAEPVTRAVGCLLADFVAR